MSRSSPRPDPNPEPPRRTPLVFAVAVAGVVMVVAAISFKRSAPPEAGASNSVGTPDNAPSAVSSHPKSDAGESSGALSEPGPPVAPSAGLPVPVPAAPAPEAKVSLAILASLDVNNPVTAAQAQQWKQALQDLVRAGPAAIPDIRAFLAKNQDLSFANVGGTGQFGYPTLRAGLIDALAQIGGQDAIDTLSQTLQSTPYPADVAALSKALDQMAPGQYQAAVLAVARQQLAVGAQGQLGPGADVGPLFQVLNNEAANGVDITDDLRQYSGKWPYYAAIALANLPNGAGVSSLISIAQANAGGYQNAAAEGLAELAGQYPDARSALMDLAKNNQLPDSLMARLAPFIAGAEYQIGQDPVGNRSFQGFHITDGNQDFSSFENPAMTRDQVSLRISMIDQILQSLPGTGADAGRQALNFQRTQLMNRLPNTK